MKSLAFSSSSGDLKPLLPHLPLSSVSSLSHPLCSPAALASWPLLLGSPNCGWLHPQKRRVTT